MLTRVLGSICLTLTATACSSKSSSGREGAAGTSSIIPTVATGSQVTAHISGNDVNAALINANQQGPIGGTSLELPAGTLATDADVTIEEGEDLVSATTAADLGAPDAGTFTAASVAIVVAATPNTTALPNSFQLTIPLTSPDHDKLVVLARYPKPAPSGPVFEALLAPGSARQLGNQMVISAPAFGAYQVAYISGTLPTGALEVPSTAPILAKGQTAPVAVTLGAFAITGPGAASASATPFAAWTASAGATSYEVMVGKTANCADKLQDISSIQSLTVPLATMPDGKYFVCVTAASAAGATLPASNNSLDFTVAATAPARFKIKGAPGHTATTATPTITWDAAAGADHYLVLVGTSSTCSSPLQIYDAVTSPTQAVTTLTSGTYYVCVTALNAAGDRRTADNTGYQIAVDTAAPGAFYIYSPSFNTNVQTLFLSWGQSANAQTYGLTIASDAACANAVKTYTNLSGTSQGVTGVTGGTYYLCVTATDAALRTTPATNNGQSFVLDVNGPPGAFSITGPSGAVHTSTPTASWTAAQNAVTYSIGIGLGSGCNSPRNQTFNVSTNSVLLSTVPDGSYAVCIAAFDALGGSTESSNDVYPFVVETSTIHIAYVTQSSGTYNVKYGNYHNGVWTIDATPIDTANGSNTLDPRVSLTLNNVDVPQVAYAFNTNGAIAAKYGHRTGTNTWATEVVESVAAAAGVYGRFNGVALGTDNTVRMTYVRDNNANAIVRLATGTTGAFVDSSIDAAPLSGAVGDTAIAMTGANQVEFVESVETSGTWAVTYRNSSNYATTATTISNASCAQMLQGSLQVDSAGATHIAYGCVTTGGACQVYYIKRSAGTFGASEYVGTITANGCTATQLANEAYRPRLAVDSTTIPRIVWWDQTNANLKYATRAGGSWQASTPVSTGTVLGHVGIALSTFDKAYLFYMDNAGLHSLSNNADSLTPTWSYPLFIDSNVVGVSDPAASGVAFHSAR